MLVLIIVPEICAAGVVGCLIYRFIRARRLRREAAANGEPEARLSTNLLAQSYALSHVTLA